MVVVLAIIGIAVAGALYLAAYPTVRVCYVATSDLPPYRQIHSTDIRLVAMPVRDLPGDVITDRGALLNRYTLTEVGTGVPFVETGLGPTLPAGRLDRVRIVALDGSAETTVAGRLARGDRVDILLSPADRVSGGEIADGLVLDVPDHPPAVVLALGESQEKVLLAARGSSRVMLVRRQSYQRP